MKNATEDLEDKVKEISPWSRTNLKKMENEGGK